MDMWERYNRDSKLLYGLHKQMNEKNYDSKIDEIYSFMKSISNDYYHKNRIDRTYEFLRKDFLFYEKEYGNELLIKPKILYSNLNQDFFIEYLIYCARKNICGVSDIDDKTNELIIQSVNLSNKCRECSEYIKKICDKNKIESYIISIYPGYDKKSMLYDGCGFHFFNIVKYNNKYYLIDVTYSQFFYKFRNNLNRLGILDTGGCDSGIFMLMTDKGKNIANTLISNGYIELNEKIFKTYLDAFTISFRNGLYYEGTNDFSFTTNYKADDYIKFLKGLDNQINHENKEYLGFQSRPLIDYKIKFKKKN